MLKSKPLIGFAPWEIELVLFDIIPAAVAIAWLALRSQQQKETNLIKLTRIPKTVAIVLLLVNFLTFSLRAMADTNHFYLVISCNPDNHIARISSSNVFNNDAPPEASISLDSLPSNKKNGEDLYICNIDDKTRVGVKGVINKDHPRNDGVILYINAKPMIHPIQIIPEIEIKSDKENKILFIKQCDWSSNCFTEKLTR